MKTRQIRIDAHIETALKRLGEKEDRSVNYLIRQALKIFLAEKGMIVQGESEEKRTLPNIAS
jgi:predicted transcriptional regulator